MIYYFIFILLLIFSAFEYYGYIKLKTKKIIVFFVSVLFIILSTIRTNTIGDYESYKRTYDNLINVDVPFWKMPFIPYEWGYSLLMYFAKLFSKDFCFFLFVQACLVMTLQYKTISFWCECFEYNSVKTGRKRNYLLTAYFICWAVFMGHVFSIRNILAIMICLYSLRFVHKKNKFKFLALVLCAATIHISVIIFLLVYAIYWTNIDFKMKILGFVTATLLLGNFFTLFVKTFMQVLPTRAQYKIQMYLQNGLGYGSGRTDMNIIIFILIKAMANVGVVIAILFLIERRRRKTRRSEICSHSMEDSYSTLYLLGAVLQVTSSFVNLALARISTPYIYFQFPLFLAFLRIYEETKWKKITYLFLVFYVGLRFFVNLYTSKEGYLPFQTIWSR